MPILISLVVILIFILPAFVLYEPQETNETISLKLAAVIAVAMSGIAAALFRIFASWWRTRRLLSEWKRDSVPMFLPAAPLPVFRLQHPFPVFAVVGLLRPRLFVGETVLAALDENEINAVINHELGHVYALDNIKRLVMKLCGDMLVAPIGRWLDRAWGENSEAAADEYAVARGDRSTALSLASALIKIARLIPDEPLPAMPSVSYVFENGESLTARIERLLRLAESGASPTRLPNGIFIPPTAIMFLIAAAFAADHTFLGEVHQISERVLAALQ